MSDLFSSAVPSSNEYDASSIEVLEGLEPVRRRPGMYIGGIDERALHHLAAEVLDNSMDEAVAGFANRIEIVLEPGNRLTISDNGRGIPIDEHPKYPGKSALEVILTTLHSGGKFSDKAYATSGGLHGVGVSVVNALSTDTVVEVARNKQLYRQTFACGVPTSQLEVVGPTPNRRGTTIAFTPDSRSSARSAKFKPARLYRLARSKAYLFAGVEIRWKCDPSLISDETPAEAVFQFPGGLPTTSRSRSEAANARPPSSSGAAGLPRTARARSNGRWPGRLWSEGGSSYYCNTIPTPDGGTHEQGIRAALTRGIRGFAELIGQKKAKDIRATTSSRAPRSCCPSSSATPSSRARPRTG
jgi:topoisomerase-4 subunit B